MNGKPKTQRQQQGRLALRRLAVTAIGISCLHRSVIQRPRTVGRYGLPVQGQQQWQTGDLRQSHKATRMGKQCDRLQGKAGIARCWFSLRNPEGAKAEQGKLVCPDLAHTRLVSGNGYSASRFHAECVSENRIRPPKNGVGAHRIAPENGVGHPATTPENGAIWAVFAYLSTPENGEYLDVAICTAALREGGNDGTR